MILYDSNRLKSNITACNEMFLNLIPVKSIRVFLWILMSVSWLQSAAQDLVVYPPPQAVIYSMHNDDYTVRVRKPGGEWQDLFEYNAKVDLDKPQDASMVYFDFSGTVEVCVRRNNESVQSVRIRPASAGVGYRRTGNLVYFTLTRPCNLSVEFNGDKLHNLHLFANPVETGKPLPGDTNVIYFGPGLHTPPDSAHGAYHISSGKTVYIAGGAVVKAKLVCDSVNDVKITGRGILYQGQEGIQVTYSNHISIDGIIVLNPAHYAVNAGQSEHIVISNLKSFSARGWGDGIDLFCCSDVAIDRVFMRNSDDCIAIYGHRWKFYGNTRNCTVSNSVLWADIAHPINIGTHGNTDIAGDTLENIRFKNIDILEHDEDDPEYQGCMAISDGDYNLIRNIWFENIRVDDFEEGQLLNLRVIFNKKYNTGPGRGIRDVYFKNISYLGANISASVIGGYDKERSVRNITFENLRINGKRMMNATSAHIQKGEFVQQLIFK